MPDKSKWGPIVLDIEFDCDMCRKRMRGRMTVYHDATYVTCSQRHHYSFDNPGQVPGLHNWRNTRLGGEADE